MTIQTKIIVALAGLLAALALMATYGYIREREALIARDAEVAVYKQDIAKLRAANVLIDKQTSEQVAVHEAKRATVQTPAQVIASLPDYLPLPEPVHEAKQGEVPKTGDVVVPAASVKPLFDAQVICRENVLKLDACNAKLANDEQVIAEKDKIISSDEMALKGGTRWQRVKTAGKWLMFGAAAGAVTVAVLHR